MFKVTKYCVVLVAVAVGGCATPPEVRNQATVIAAHVATVKGNLQQFAASEKRRTSERANRILEVEQAIDAAAMRAQLRLLSQQEAMLSGVMDLVTLQEEAVASSEARRNALLKEVKAGSVPLEANAEDLSTVSESLAALAVEEDRKERFKRVIKFVKATAKEYRALQDEAEKATEEADRTGVSKSEETKQQADMVAPSS